MAWRVTSFECALCLAVVAPQATGAWFLSLGHLPGHDSTHSYAHGTSADGSVVVGASGEIGWWGEGGEAFHWTSDKGMIGLGDLPGGSGSVAAEVSADGSVVVGTSGGGGVFRWSRADGMVALVLGIGTGVSADGSVVVGSRTNEAFRWTSADGVVGLGDLPGGMNLSSATGVSADGSVVVGSSHSMHGQEAFRWTNKEGMVGLGDLPGGAIFHSIARDASNDGSVIVGSASIEGGDENSILSGAFRWTPDGGMVPLGDLSGLGSVATGVSGDGSVVVGLSYAASATEAFVWDATSGMHSVSSVLTGMGIHLDGWTLHEASAISADGTTIVGYGINPRGHTEAWLANLQTVPEPSTIAIAIFGVVLVAALRPRNPSSLYERKSTTQVGLIRLRVDHRGRVNASTVVMTVHAHRMED